ncbi:response regulator [Aquabacterium sp.]|uniref:response regulator n=1 Tax=Aquabacterium sp. TaxID=1872578 RepID=UPI003784425C
MPLTPETTKVLLIDDHQLTRSLLRGLLKNEGYHQFREAADAPSGLKIATHFSPDLVCLDVQMPGKTGLDMLAELREAVPHAVILMVTAQNDRDTVVACINAGAHGYIVKPFNALTIIKVIEGALAKRGLLAAPAAGAPARK